MFRSGEAETCPACGLELSDMTRLPPSYEGSLEEDWPEKPQFQDLPLLYWKRGRLALLLAAVAGVALFFAPWIHQTAPEVDTLSGFDMARRLGWMWGVAVSWAMLVPVVLSRRSVDRMRGARVITSIFCAIPLLAGVILLLRPPRPPPLLHIAIAFHYGLGLYGTMALSLAAIPFALMFGGRVDTLPTTRGHGSHEHLN
jgi:hypothetical protein